MSYGKVVPRVIIAHVFLLGIFLLVPLLQKCTWFKKPPVETIQIDLGSLPPLPPPPEPPESVDEDPEEDVIPESTPIPTPKPAPTATPRPEATPQPTATPKPTATPRPVPTPTPKRRLLTPEQIRRRIENQQQPVEPPPAAPTLSPEQIQALMSDGLPSNPSISGLPAGGGGGSVNFGGVANVLYKKLFSAWDQPRNLSASSGITASAEVVVAKDGRILSSRFVRRSGVEEFDQSVQSALSSVTRATPLPANFEGTSKAFEFEFELSR